MPKKILIIEDEPALVDALSSLLRARDLEVSGAFDGVSGITKAKVEKPDLIILDLNMPLMNGFKLAEMLRADSDTKKIPIIVISGVPKEDLQSKFSKIRAVDFISKPFNSSELVKKVEKALMLK